MTDIRIVRDYPHPRAKVWRALTDPTLIPLWTATGQGGRPEGFSATVGTRFPVRREAPARLARGRRLRGPRGT